MVRYGMVWYGAGRCGGRRATPGDIPTHIVLAAGGRRWWCCQKMWLSVSSILSMLLLSKAAVLSIHLFVLILLD